MRSPKPEGGMSHPTTMGGGYEKIDAGKEIEVRAVESNRTDTVTSW